MRIQIWINIVMNEDTKINKYWNEWGYKDEWILEWMRKQRLMNMGMKEDTKINEYWNEWGYEDEWILEWKRIED